MSTVKGTPQQFSPQMEDPRSQGKNSIPMNDCVVTCLCDNSCCGMTRCVMQPGQTRIVPKHLYNYCAFVVHPSTISFMSTTGEPICELVTKAGECYHMRVTDEGCKICAKCCTCSKDTKGRDLTLPHSYAIRNMGTTPYEVLYVDMKQDK